MNVVVTKRWATGACRSYCATIALLLVTIFFSVDTAHAQVTGLTPEQQQLLNQLPPNQRQALLDRFLAATSSREGPAESVPTDVDSAQTESLEFEEPLPEDVDPDVIEPFDTIVVLISESDDLAPSDDSFEQIQRVLNGNPYVIDVEGQLKLPGIEGISLLGLTEEQATIRLQIDQLFRGSVLEVIRLPVRQRSIERLEAFGYDMLRNAQRQRSRDSGSLPVPSGYVMGAGDEVRVQLFGGQNAAYDLTVDRDGRLGLPGLEPIVVAGMSFDALRQEVSDRVGEQFIGTQASVTLGQLRTVQVVVTGDVENPGNYQLNAMSSVLDVLFASGGISNNGSLRNVQLKRQGQLIGRLDLYDILIRGDSRNNRRVRNGDLVFVPPVGQQVRIGGAVKRPAIYELRGKSSISAAIDLAGGVEDAAMSANVRVERLTPGEGVSVAAVSLDSARSADFTVSGGDTIFVPRSTDRLDRAVTLEGHVYQPGLYQWSSGQKIGDLISSASMLRPNADLRYVLIVRGENTSGPISALSVNLEKLWGQPGAGKNPLLTKGDRVIVFSREEGRRIYLDPLIDRLRQQGWDGLEAPVVSVGGSVNEPGEYPFEPDMKVSDLIRAGGGLAESAFKENAELTRFTVVTGQSRNTELMQVSLQEALSGGGYADLPLQASDYLNVKEISRWNQTDIVEIRGEVLFPGSYPVFHGETLASLLDRAGGMTELAFPEGSVFTRETLKSREREQLEQLAARVESDLASLALTDPSQTEAISIGQSLLTQLRDAEPAGRLVIDIAGADQSTATDDILLRGGDLLVIPPKKQEVTVLGEVQYSTSHLWDRTLDREAYIERSGGITVKADKRRIYVVRANGQVVVSPRSRFFSKSKGTDIRPGDTIVVPLDTDRTKPLLLWSSATQILYNLAIAAAAVNSF